MGHSWCEKGVRKMTLKVKGCSVFDMLELNVELFTLTSEPHSGKPMGTSLMLDVCNKLIPVLFLSPLYIIAA